MTEAATLATPAPNSPPAMTGPTPAEIFTFDNTGYLVLENFLAPAHVTRLLAALDRAVTCRRAKVAVDPAEKRNTLINGERSTRLLYILEDDPLFLELVDWAPLMPYVHALINPKPHYHASDAIVEQGSELLSRRGGWHIDGNDQGYRGFGWPIPLLQLKVGYYLTDMTQPGNANLMVVPGSHKSRHVPSLRDLEAQQEWPGAVQVCAPAGSAILFHNALFHSAAPYASPAHHRTMLYYAYEHPWMIGALGHWNYSREFYNRRLTPAQRKLFHGFVFDPPEQRWG